MYTDDYVDVVRAEGGRLLEAAALDLDAPVPACSGWTVADLVGHIGQVYGYVVGVVRDPSTERPSHGFPERPGVDEVLAWGRVRLEEVVDALGRVEPGTPCWNWGSGDVIDFYPRRMAHETVVHRHDVEAAVDALTPIDSDVAADGVDELLDVGMQHSANPKKVFTYPSGSLHLHRTDGDGEWMVRPGGTGITVTREHAKGDVAVRGAAPDLLLYLWGRGGSDLEVFGDADLAAEWARVAP